MIKMPDFEPQTPSPAPPCTRSNPFKRSRFRVDFGRFSHQNWPKRSKTSKNWSAANGGLRDGGLRKSEDIGGKRPFSSDIQLNKTTKNRPRNRHLRGGLDRQGGGFCGWMVISHNTSLVGSLSVAKHVGALRPLLAKVWSTRSSYNSRKILC